MVHTLDLQTGVWYQRVSLISKDCLWILVLPTDFYSEVEFICLKGRNDLKKWSGMRHGFCIEEASPSEACGIWASEPWGSVPAVPCSDLPNHVFFQPAAVWKMWAVNFWTEFLPWITCGRKEVSDCKLNRILWGQLLGQEKNKTYNM